MAAMYHSRGVFDSFGIPNFCTRHDTRTAKIVDWSYSWFDLIMWFQVMWVQHLFRWCPHDHMCMLCTGTDTKIDRAGCHAHCGQQWAYLWQPILCILLTKMRMLKKIACLRNWYMLKYADVPGLHRKFFIFCRGVWLSALLMTLFLTPGLKKINLELTSVFYVLYHIIMLSFK